MRVRLRCFIHDDDQCRSALTVMPIAAAALALSAAASASSASGATAEAFVAFIDKRMRASRCCVRRCESECQSVARDGNHGTQMCTNITRWGLGREGGRACGLSTLPAPCSGGDDANGGDEPIPSSSR